MSMARRLRTWPWPVHVAGGVALIAACVATALGVPRDAERHLARGQQAALTTRLDVGFPMGGDRFVIVDARVAQVIADSAKLVVPPGVAVDSFALEVTPWRISYSRDDMRYAAPGVRVATTAWMRVAPGAPVGASPLRLQLPPIADALAPAGYKPAVYDRSSDLQAGHGLWTSRRREADAARAVTLTTLTVHGSRVGAALAVLGHGLTRFALVALAGSLCVLLVLWGLASMGRQTQGRYGLEEDSRASLPRIPRRV
jgi:hypothetical protein